MFRELSNKTAYVNPEGHFVKIYYASSGGGKSMALEADEQDLIERGYVSIHIDTKNTLEGAFIQFPVADHKQIKILKSAAKDVEALKQRSENGDEKATQMLKRIPKPAIIYHPFSNFIPPTDLPPFNKFRKSKFPPMQLFTIPMPDFSDWEFQFLLGKGANNETFKMVTEAVNKLRKDEGMFKFIEILKDMTEIEKKKIGDKEIAMPSMTDWGLENTTAGTVQNLTTIRNTFHQFDEYPLISSESNPFNLDFEKILNDRDHVHILSLKYVPSQFIRFFVSLYWKRKILETRPYSKFDVCFTEDEIAIAHPKKPKESGGMYRVVYANLSQNFLRTCRTYGITYLTGSQTRGGFDDSIRTLFTLAMQGKLGTEQLDDIRADFGIGKWSAEDLKALKTGEFLDNENPDRGVIIALPPRHAHKAEGETYEQVYEKYFPERMMSFRELKKQRQEQVNAEFEVIKQAIMRKRALLETEEKKRQEQESKVEENKKVIETLKTESKEDKDKIIKIRNDLLVRLYQEAVTPHERSYRTLADKLTKSGHPIGKSAVEKLVKKLIPSTIKKNEVSIDTK